MLQGSKFSSALFFKPLIWIGFLMSVWLHIPHRVPVLYIRIQVYDNEQSKWKMLRGLCLRHSQLLVPLNLDVIFQELCQYCIFLVSSQIPSSEHVLNNKSHKIHDTEQRDISASLVYKAASLWITCPP